MLGLSGADQSAGDRVFAVLLGGGHELQHLGALEARQHVQIGELRAASVRVPVLSSATICADCRPSSAAPLLNSTPSSAALPVPTITLTGVARPIAQGQAMISTATVLTRA